MFIVGFFFFVLYKNSFFFLSFPLLPVPDDNQLFNYLLWVHGQIHSRLRGSGIWSDSSLLSRVWEPAAGHGKTRAELRRSAGRVREPLHRQPRLWELRCIRHGRIRLLLAGKLRIWFFLALINGAAGCRCLRQTLLSLHALHLTIPAIYCQWQVLVRKVLIKIDFLLFKKVKKQPI